MKTRIILIAAAVMMAAAAAGVATKLKVDARHSRKAHPAYTLHSRVTLYHTDGSPLHIFEQVRYVSRRGGYRVVRTGTDKLREFFFAPGRGHFTVDDRNQKLLRDKRANTSAAPAALTAEELRSHPQFHRAEKILGFTAYVHRVMSQQTEQPAADHYYTEELGWIPLKTVTYHDGKLESTTEPVSVAFGEPDHSLLRGPDFPVVDR